MPAGRPTDYCIETVNLICERIADGETLRAICADADMPAKATVFGWLVNHKEFSDRYARAREAQGDALIEEAREIVDDGTNDWMERQDKEGRNIGWQINGEAVQRSRLRAEQRRWEAAKLKPTVYGDKQFIEHSGSITFKDASDEDLIAELFELARTGHLALPPGYKLVELDAEEDFSDLA